MKMIQTYNIIIKTGEFAGRYKMCRIDSLDKAEMLLKKYWDDGNHAIVPGEIEHEVDYGDLFD